VPRVALPLPFFFFFFFYRISVKVSHEPIGDSLKPRWLRPLLRFQPSLESQTIDPKIKSLEHGLRSFRFSDHASPERVAHWGQ